MTVVIKLGHFYLRFITVRKWKIDFLRPTCNLKIFKWLTNDIKSNKTRHHQQPKQ